MSVTDIDPDDNYFSALFESLNCEQQSEYCSIEKYNDLCRDENYYTIFHVNIRSFRANSDSFLALFENSLSYPDVVILSETWFSSNYTDTIPGYEPYHIYRTNNIRSGGISIYVKNQNSSRVLPDLSFCNEKVEVCVVEVNLYSEKIFIIGVYRPHSGTTEEFISALNLILESPELRNQTIYILGDLNLNLLCESIQTNSFIDNMYSYHFVPLISKPTRFSTIPSVSPTLLDQIWTNNMSTTISGIVLSDFSDHLPIFARLLKRTIDSQPNKTVKVTFRLNNEENFDKLCSSLIDFDWNSLKTENLNQYLENFLSVLNEKYCEFFPMKTKYVSVKTYRKPWINADARRLIYAKSQYFKLYQLGFITKEENNNYKNRVKSQLIRLKNSYFKNLFLRNIGDIGKTWKIIRDTCMQSTPANITVHGILSDGILQKDEFEISNTFNNFFSEIPLKLDNDLPPSNIDPLSFVQQSINHYIFFEPVTFDECHTIIMNLKNTRQAKDQIPVKIFKQCCTIFIPTICDIINTSFSSGVFPNLLKCAIVTPIFKNGDRKNPSNYRPISILPILSKVLEKAMFKRVTNFISTNSIISNSQFGFTRGKSTQDAIINLTEFLYETLNRRDIAICTFLDFRKAFDVVNHSILLRKLYKYGIRGRVLELFSSYLQNRSQVVRINNTFSTPRTNNIGVPQGSLLGPLLFLLYINDLPEISDLAHVTLFADDTTLAFRSNCFSNLFQICNEEIAKFSTWSHSNRLSINQDKSNYMLITTRHQPESRSSVQLDGSSMQIINECKFLGVVIDSELKFNHHIEHIKNKISRSVGILYKLKSILPTTTMRSLYYSLIHPYLLYCLSVWGSTYRTHLNFLFLVQKRAIRLISNASYYEHTNPLFLSHKILKLDDLYLFQLGVYVFKNLENFNFVSEHSHDTRHGGELRPPFQRLRTTQQSVFYQGCKLWNELPERIKMVDTLEKFKTSLKNYYLDKYQQENELNL